MAVRLKAALQTMLDAMFPDNLTREISPMDLRSQLMDHIDTFLTGPAVQATDSSIVVDRSTPGVIRLSADTSGGTPTPTTYPTLVFGTSADSTPTGGELTIAGAMGQGVIPVYADHRHHLIGRLASEGDISRVFYSDDPSMDNAIGAYAKWPSTLIPAGETEAFHVWVTNQALTQSADVTVTVS